LLARPKAHFTFGAKGEIILGTHKLEVRK